MMFMMDGYEAVHLLRRPKRRGMNDGQGTDWDHWDGVHWDHSR
jgi:hypothetical protein